jgi:hypothetical protein
MRAAGLGIMLGTLVAALATSCGSNEPADSDGSDTGGSSGDGSGGSPSGDGEGGDSNTGGGASDGEAGAGPSGGESNGSGGESDGSGGESDGSGGGGPAMEGCELVWSSGFETGFPGTEWLNYDDGSYSEDGSVPDGRTDAWTIIDTSSGEPIYSGDHAYKGWVTGPSSGSHRAYPVIHTDITTPIVNTYMVYLDLDYDAVGGDWVHVGTWGNEEEGGVGDWALHTMSIRERQLEFAHTTPNLGEYIGPNPEPDFPLGQWVRFTVYMIYEGTTGFVQVWQDGVPMLSGEVSSLADNPGTRVTRAHWGMYGPATLSSGTQYCDDIAIWKLDAPLTDFENEPSCYLDP